MGGVKIFGRSNQTRALSAKGRLFHLRAPTHVTFKTRNSLQFHAYSSHFLLSTKRGTYIYMKLLPPRTTFSNTNFNGIIEIWSSALSLLVHTKQCRSLAFDYWDSMCVHWVLCDTESKRKAITKWWYRLWMSWNPRFAIWYENVWDIYGRKIIMTMDIDIALIYGSQG